MMISIRNFRLLKTTSVKGIVFDMVFVGIMLGFVILFQFLEQYMSWLGTSSALKINASLVFIMAAWLISGYPWALLLLIIRFIIGPAFSSLSYTWIGLYSTFLLFFSEVVYLLIFTGFFYLFKNIIKNDTRFILTVLFTSLFLSIIFLTIMNGLWMSPVFWRLFSSASPLYPQIIKYYENNSFLHIFLFGIPNYWAGIWILFGTGNLLKFGIITILVFPLIKVSRYLT